jgi:hypothetical protein
MQSMVALATPPTDSLFAHIADAQPAPVIAADDAPQVDGRAHVIDLILQTNRSATRSWLDRFDDRALEEYLRHLQASQMPRGRMAFWMRTTAAPAITMADAPE